MLTRNEAFDKLNEREHGHYKLVTPLRRITRNLHDVPSDASVIKVVKSRHGYNEFIYTSNVEIKAVQNNEVL